MTEYEATDAAQHARFVAFTAECERLVQSASGHQHVVGFVRTLDLDAMRALYKLAAEANATVLLSILGMVHEEKFVHVPTGGVS